MRAYDRVTGRGGASLVGALSAAVVAVSLVVAALQAAGGDGAAAVLSTVDAAVWALWLGPYLTLAARRKEHAGPSAGAAVLGGDWLVVALARLWTLLTAATLVAAAVTLSPTFAVVKMLAATTAWWCAVYATPGGGRGVAAVVRGWLATPPQRPAFARSR
jgi:hypothetical protein